MTMVDIAEQANGFRVVKTEGKEPAGRSYECQDEIDLLSLLRGWSLTEAAIQKAFQDLRMHGLANVDLV